MKDWQAREKNRKTRIADGALHASGKIIAKDKLVAFLQAVVRPYDRVSLEADNQKQADGFTRALSQVDPAKVHDLHVLKSGILLPEHLDLFDKGIARRLDYSYSGLHAARIAHMLSNGKIELGAVHTHLQLFARYFIDLTPQVALVAAVSADRHGNLYTGPETENTSTVIEAANSRNGLVIAEVGEIVENVPRIDIRGNSIHFIVDSGKPFYVEPLFTRDPAAITEPQILTAMIAIKGLYQRYGIRRLYHGICHNTAAIELLLPTFAEKLGLRGKICTHWAMNPHPTLIPAIEAGWVDQIHCFGSEAGMEDYIRSRSDIFFTGAGGSLLSDRAFSQAAGLHACDLIIGSALQIDTSSTIAANHVAGFGGTPNTGADVRVRPHLPPCPRAGREADPDMSAPLRRGRKLVVQIGETFGEGNAPLFVEKGSALDLAEQLHLSQAPTTVYADNATHIVTEEGIANLLLCRDKDEYEQAIRGVSAFTEIGRKRDRKMVERLRERKVIQRPEDLGIDPIDADRNMLSARSIKDLMVASGGLYRPPIRLRNS